MIIITIIILYFIQIRHTDDFPSTGTRLVRVITRVDDCDIITSGRSKTQLGLPCIESFDAHEAIIITDVNCVVCN